MSPTVWGPKVWYLLHRMAYYSQRTDVAGAWRSMLVLLNKTIPCKICKKHMHEYCIEHPLTFPSSPTGEQIRDVLVQWTYNFHNSVNRRNGKEVFDMSMYKYFYGIGIHTEAISDCRRVLRELEEMWKPNPTTEWSNSVRYLLGLLNGGPMVS